MRILVFPEGVSLDTFSRSVFTQSTIIRILIDPSRKIRKQPSQTTARRPKERHGALTSFLCLSRATNCRQQQKRSPCCTSCTKNCVDQTDRQIGFEDITLVKVFMPRAFDIFVQVIDRSNRPSDKTGRKSESHQSRDNSRDLRPFIRSDHDDTATNTAEQGHQRPTDSHENQPWSNIKGS